MKSPQEFTLIDSTFSPIDAKELLMNVYSSKIQFHLLKNFSSQERFGKDDKTAVNRIPQLKKSVEKINKMVTGAKAKKGKFKITSVIQISFIPSEK